MLLSPSFARCVCIGRPLDRLTISRYAGEKSRGALGSLARGAKLHGQTLGSSDPWFARLARPRIAWPLLELAYFAL